VPPNPIASRPKISTTLPHTACGAAPAPPDALAAVAIAGRHPRPGPDQHRCRRLRSNVVRALPQTASFYALLGLPVNLRGLTFDDVVTTTEQHDGVPTLFVEGTIFNGARKAEDVPRLKFVVRNAARQEIYSWTTTPSRDVLPPGETVSFRTWLASPPSDAHDLVLRFVNRREFITGAR
jgi:hypothetical protein